MAHRYLQSILNLSYIVLLFLTGVVSVHAQDHVPTNDEILLRLCLSSLNKSELIDTLSQPVYPAGNLSEHHKFKTVQLLLKKNKSVHETKKNTAVLKLMLLTNNSYKKLNKKFGLRSIKGYLTASVIDTNGAIEGEERYKINYTDTIPNKIYKTLTGSWNQTVFETKPQKSRFWNRVIQPALLLSSVGVTIFLLFNVRGK